MERAGGYSDESRHVAMKISMKINEGGISGAETRKWATQRTW